MFWYFFFLLPAFMSVLLFLVLNPPNVTQQNHQIFSNKPIFNINFKNGHEFKVHWNRLISNTNKQNHTWNKTIMLLMMMINLIAHAVIIQPAVLSVFSVLNMSVAFWFLILWLCAIVVVVDGWFCVFCCAMTATP